MFGLSDQDGALVVFAIEFDADHCSLNVSQAPVRVSAHARQRFIERTGCTKLRDLYDEFRPAMKHLLFAADRSGGCNAVVTPRGHSPFIRDEAGAPVLTTWIPDAWTRHEELPRLERIEAARVAGEWVIAL
jgi:hypothetical protein